MLDGIGIFLQRLKNCEQGDVDTVISRADQVGLTWLAVKSGSAYRDNQWTPAIAKDFITRCHDTGIQVLTWHVSRPDTAAAEIQHILGSFEDGVDGHIVNAESAWDGRDEEAELFMSRLRSKLGADKFLAHMPFAIASRHRNFPYAEFGKYCDAVMPQCSWVEMGLSMTEAADAMDKGFAALAKSSPESVKPIYPAGSSSGSGFTTDDMAAFIKRYRGCYPSLNRYDGTAPETFEALRKLYDAGELDQDPEPEVDTAPEEPIEL